MSWLLTRGRMPFLAALLVATAWLGSHAARVGIETSNASLDGRDPEELATYERFRRSFGSDEDLLLALAHPRLLEPEGLRFVASLAERIEALDGVRGVHSLANARELVPGELGAELAPLLPRPFEGPELARAVARALDRNPAFTGLLVSRDRRTAGIWIELEERPGDQRTRAELIAALRALAADAERAGASLHLTGIAVQKHDVSAMIRRDERLLMPLAALVLGATLALFFRSLVGVLLPLGVTGISVAWTLGAYRLAGLELNAITSLLPPVLMVLSLAVSVHLVQGWLDAPDPRAPRALRVRGVARRLAFPCFFCSLTTALGFASLATSPTPAVAQFGIFAALGVLVSFGVGMTLVPVGLSFLPPPASALRAPQHRLLRGALDGAAELSTRRPGVVLAAFLGITLVAAAGLPLVRNNTDLVRFLRDDAPLLRDTLFVDAHLTGASALEFVVARRDGAPLTDLDAVTRLASFEAAALRREPVTGVRSVLDLLRQIQRAEAGGPLALPADEAASVQAFDLLEAAREEPLVRKLLSADLREARVSVRVRAVGSSVAAPLVESLLAEGRGLFGPDYLLVATGAFTRVARDSNRLVRSQLESFGAALGLVFLAIGALFRSARLVLVALVPNLMPVLWTGGMMGFLGIDLSTGTAMIASAVIGVVVDDTIHYLVGYRREYRGDAREAVRRTTRSVGAPLFVNNLVLVLGFWVGCFGSFKPTLYFSLLSGITMLTALVCDLLVTPACLVLTERRRRGPRMRLSALALALSIPLAAAPARAEAPATRHPAPATRHAARLDGAQDEIVARALVPSPEQRVGEVRLIRRADADVVQTLLATKLLRRAVGEIRRKELAGWPEGSGRADALRYLDMLEAVQQQLFARVSAAPPRSDRRQKLWIEFVLAPDEAFVACGAFEMDESQEPPRVLQRETLALLEPSRDYVWRNMWLIAADAFRVEGDALAALLAPLALLRSGAPPGEPGR